MTLYLISLGLYNLEDISIKAKETAKKCDILFHESYTHYFPYSTKKLSKFLNKKVGESKRENIENNSKEIIDLAKNKKVGILIGGDALSATTHSSLILEAKEKNVAIKIIHGSSILTAIAETGLFLYNFGKITSIPFNNKNITTPLTVLKQNKNLHTLFLLDLKDKEYLTAVEAIKYLLSKGMSNKLCIICAGLGSNNQEIIAGKAKDLIKKKINKKPQCLIIPGKLHFIEQEFIEMYLNKK